MKKNLRYPNEEPSKLGGCSEEAGIIDLTTFGLETKKDDEYNQKDNNDDFIDDYGNEEEDDGIDEEDDSLDINDFFTETKSLSNVYSRR